jgi:ribosomal protein S18 acetylase RimI-like enzyme
MTVRHSIPNFPDPLIVRKMAFTDISTVVDIHLKGFLGFFLTYLGKPFLCELYTAIVMDPDGIGFVVENENGISGFVTGTVQSASFYRRLLRQRWWRFALAAVLPVLNRPLIIPRLLRGFSMPGHRTNQIGRGTLMSIAVLPDRQGEGIGQVLVRAFLEEAVYRGLRQVDLTTDRDNNEAANRFYQDLGFVCERTYVTQEGRAMNEYVIDLSLGSAI